jgi:pSer/pThr/pTyr-binding forkhead associated (FHA) protein
VDAFTLSLWILRIAFVVLIYLFFVVLVRALWRDLRSAVQTSATPLGRLVVVASPEGRPERGASIPLDAVTTLGREVNNSVVVDDESVSSEHALLTFRGRAWYLEDRGSTNGTYVNGQRIDDPQVLGYGDEIALGGVRLRLERAVPERQGMAA